MPAGMSWGRYLTFFGVGITVAFAGAQVVHEYYKPMGDIEELVQEELDRRRKARRAEPVHT